MPHLKLFTGGGPVGTFSELFLLYFYGKINSLEVPPGPPPVNYLNGALIQFSIRPQSLVPRDELDVMTVATQTSECFLSFCLFCFLFGVLFDFVLILLICES